MLLLADALLPARRAAAAGPLAPLADSLAADLEPLRGRDPFIPQEKARLSRAGGVCPTDGTRLEFDPFSPRLHRCPRCGQTQTGEAHYRWWIMGYQLWLAERSVHASALALVRHAAWAAPLARSILARYAECYGRYPNRDNALGPSRPFFSTYLESIWLLQLCVALDLLEAAGESEGVGEPVRERVIAPSVALIASFDEGASNRQVWNNAALLAAGRLLCRTRDVEHAIRGPSGLAAHLAASVLDDGTWYEGENYHLFAHRGLWYGVALAEAAGIELPPQLLHRFDEGFAAPLLSALPDLTLPARRDSHYAISLRQWRVAEMCELGLARRDDERLVAALHALYTGDTPRRDTGRARSTAEAEHNLSATALGRADLGWRSLLHALPELPTLRPRAQRSALLDGQGLAVFRRERGEIYVALDYGHSGGGHGHPDRLNLLLADGVRRWLDDPGTGSYVERSLHWYRSTLAHNAPLVDGRSQLRVHGALAAYDEREGAGWVDALVSGIAPEVDVRRTLVVMSEYAIDRLEWRAPAEVHVDLPFHLAGDLEGTTAWRAAPLQGGGGLEDGFDFVRDTAVSEPLAGVPTRITVRGEPLKAWIALPPDSAWWRATAPGAPGTGDAVFVLARMRGTSGSLIGVWSWRGAVADVVFAEDAIRVHLLDGSLHEHARSEGAWHVALTTGGGATSGIHLAGLRPRAAPPPVTRHAAYAWRAEPRRVPRAAAGALWWSEIDESLRAQRLHVHLAEPHYRRSEETWLEAGSPSATVALHVAGEALVIEVDVQKGELTFVPPGAVNDLDNEPADINGDGLQLYVVVRDEARAPPRRGAAWVLVPEPYGAMRASAVQGYPQSLSLRSTWRLTPKGYAVRCEIPLDQLRPSLRFDADVIVNESAPGRERRRGQLVMSGGAGEFVYLRGDRQPAERLLSFIIADA